MQIPDMHFYKEVEKEVLEQQKGSIFLKHLFPQRKIQPLYLNLYNI